MTVIPEDADLIRAEYEDGLLSVRWYSSWDDPSLYGKDLGFVVRMPDKVYGRRLADLINELATSRQELARARKIIFDYPQLVEEAKKSAPKNMVAVMRMLGDHARDEKEGTDSPKTTMVDLARDMGWHGPRGDEVDG